MCMLKTKKLCSHFDHYVLFVPLSVYWGKTTSLWQQPTLSDKHHDALSFEAVAINSVLN